MSKLSDFKSTGWKELVAKYQAPHTWKGLWQLFNSIIPFIVLWYGMFRSLEVSYWLTLLLSLPTAGFLVRVFIIQHDCGHGSFFSSKKANNMTGLLCSIFTWTPYFYWRKGHGIHHATAGNLKSRGIGDVFTMTVKEYQALTAWGRFKYRFYRNPLFLIVFIPAIVFMLWYRFPTTRAKALKKVESSVYWTDLAIGLLVGTVIYFTGFKAFLMIQVPVMIFAASIGQWLFFVQHQFENTYWADDEEWDYTQAALQGSSYYKLPKVLQWFTGNIGFHHIHHLNPAIPNYMLEKCHKNVPLFKKAVVLNIRTSLKSLMLGLWDEEQKKLISFRQFRRRSMFGV